MFASRKTAAVSYFFFALAAFLPGPASGEDPAAAEDARRPPDALAVADPIHDDLEALAARGMVDLPNLFARPLLRYDVGLALARALAAHPSLQDDLAFQRVRSAFAAELDALGFDREPAGAHQGLLSLRDDENWLRAEAFWNVQAEAAPDRGFVLTDSTRFGLRFSWIIWPGFHLFEELYVADIKNGRLFGDPVSPGTDVIIFQDRVYGAMHTRYADFVLGRDRLAWGPGVTGTLLLSETARPFTQLRFSRTFFDGLFHAVIVNGVLNQAEQRYVAYHRLDWRPHARFRLGLAEGSRYNSSGLQPLYLIGIIPYPVVTRLLLRDNDNRETDPSVRDNVMWSLDGTWRAHPRLSLYGELLIDDLGIQDDDHPTRIGYQAGAYAVGDLLEGELRARCEWTRVWNYVYSTFYHHDFEHEGVALGYPLGPDSRHVQLRADWARHRDWSLIGTAARIDRGEGVLGDAWLPNDPAFAGAQAGEFEGVVERQWLLTAGCRYAPAFRLDALVEIGPAWVKSANHIRGNDRRGLTGRLSLAYRY